MNEAICLVDANNFYASAHQMFEAAYEDRPLVILSNNDGNIISRNAIAKKLVPMGAPIFEVRKLLEKHNAVILSSNYALYGDMSFCFQSILDEYSPDIEHYSVDECFILVPTFYNTNLAEMGRDMLEKVRALSGIKVSVGIGSTKTISKIAVELAKNSERARGAVNLYKSPYLEKALAQIEITDVWGIGEQRATLLKRNGIYTALDLRDADDNWIRRRLTISGLKTVHELREIKCFPLEPTPKIKKQICVSRSFGKATDDIREMIAAMAFFTARAAEKLREGKLLAGKISIFIESDRFKTDIPQYANTITFAIAPLSDDTREILRLVLRGLSQIYLPGFLIRRAGVLISELQLKETAPGPLWESDQQDQNARIMKIIDEINAKYGTDSITCGLFPNTGVWKSRFEFQSPAYTTNWQEIMEVR